MLAAPRTYLPDLTWDRSRLRTSLTRLNRRIVVIGGCHLGLHCTPERYPPPHPDLHLRLSTDGSVAIPGSTQDKETYWGASVTPSMRAKVKTSTPGIMLGGSDGT